MTIFILNSVKIAESLAKNSFSRTDLSVALWDIEGWVGYSDECQCGHF